MKNISEIDSNFIVDTKIEKKGIRFFDCKSKPFKVYGVFYDNGKFRRMPENVAKSVNSGVSGLHSNTAGGRVRFITDSKYVAISAVMENLGIMPHFALSGSAGFDLYIGGEFYRSFMPDYKMTEGYESVVEFNSEEMREITINFPLYSDVKDLYIGLDGNASVCESANYKYDKPIVFYGSSITQGGCASRPGTAYQGHISRRFNCDFINLGFSGSARGEDEMAKYISSLSMKMFVYDYDYNAPDVEHLEMTHERMFKIIRQSQPELPVIIMSRPKYRPNEEEILRKAIVKKTYENAVFAGDKNVWFIDGKDLMSHCLNDGSVDGTHPTDFGFWSMAKVLGDFIERNNLL